jgi:hypothetical protein
MQTLDHDNTSKQEAVWICFSPFVSEDEGQVNKEYPIAQDHSSCLGGGCLDLSRLRFQNVRIPFG